MLQVFYELTPNVYTEMQTVRWKQWQVGTMAQVGQVNTGKIPFDDPAGTLDIKGWRKVRVYETTATPTLLWSGRIRNKTVKRGDSERGSLRTTADRWWDCDANDQNTLMGARIIRGDSGKRPAETAGERLAWLLGTSFTIFVDNGHVTYPSDALDANDYSLQTAADVIADCATPGGYNWFALQVDDTDFPELFFMLPEDSDWSSSISISDDLADVDSETVFAPNYAADLHIADEIIAAGVAVPYNDPDESGAYVYVSDSDIGDEFAFVDKAAPMANVKTASKATVIADRHQVLASTEAEKITCTIHVPADKANAVRPWHRIPYKSTWMPNFSEYRDCRVINWSIEQQPFSDGGDGYLVHLELSPVEGEPVSCSVGIAAADATTNTGVEAGGTDATVIADVTSTMPGSGVVIAVLAADNGNTPNSENMGTPSGFSTFDAQFDIGRMTYFFGYKAVSGGSQNTSASFESGFASEGAWAAAQVWFPWNSISVVQESEAGFGVASITLPDPPTLGNTILMFGFNDKTVASSVPGSAGPGTGWTELFSVLAGTVPGNGLANIAVWARCADPADGEVYDYTANGPVSLMAAGTYLVEIATS